MASVEEIALRLREFFEAVEKRSTAPGLQAPYSPREHLKNPMLRVYEECVGELVPGERDELDRMIRRCGLVGFDEVLVRSVRATSPELQLGRRGNATALPSRQSPASRSGPAPRLPDAHIPRPWFGNARLGSIEPPPRRNNAAP